MKHSIILCTACVFVLASVGFARADDISELKEQIKTLSAKIEALEAKQESQAKEIKKVPELAEKVSALKQGPASLLEGVNVGGHLKMYMFDRTDGSRNGESQHTDISAGINHAYIFFTKEIEDWLKLDVQTDISVSASATPTIGSDIVRADSATTTFKLYQAFMTALLTQGYELKVGSFNPMFSEEYAKETWWHELYHQNTGLVYLQQWHDTGIELYKNFDFDKWSLPVYFSVLNGNQFVDNNEDKTVLLHIAPEFFQTKLRLLGSIGTGLWGDGNNGRALYSLGGFDWKYQKFNLTSEYLYRKYGHVTTTGNANADGKNEGYYVRAMYTFDPKWRALVKYSHAELYQTGLVNMRSNNYDTTTLAVNYFLTPSSDIIAQYSFIEGNRSDASEKIKANRFTLGWRTTF